ncbi:I78 family peptidase inhibitor [Pseudoxanthomonas dokdonensis]|uniref:Peptidase inhibitor I78 family protein n=1 Tax=Pseudoxanthomonas dokdonensis TaxID=344882 RepID=A0A0R0D0M7_9GAMM|nr:I78 family peptidase inhibitor [Pseudoxanthomonas dokdonensis]KRG72014.1 hypothetical protein ABB29_00675 [Pseudoxanthomonas dokdonensis]
MPIHPIIHVLRVAGLGLMLGLTACASSAPEPARVTGGPAPAFPVPAGACHADKVQWAIGKTGDQDTLRRVWQESGAGLIRPLAPNQPVTREYKPDRVNVSLDASNVITAITCG